MWDIESCMTCVKVNKSLKISCILFFSVFTCCPYCERFSLKVLLEQDDTTCVYVVLWMCSICVCNRACVDLMRKNRRKMQTADTHQKWTFMDWGYSYSVLQIPHAFIQESATYVNIACTWYVHSPMINLHTQVLVPLVVCAKSMILCSLSDAQVLILILFFEGPCLVHYFEVLFFKFHDAHQIHEPYMCVCVCVCVCVGVCVPV